MTLLVIGHPSTVSDWCRDNRILGSVPAIYRPEDARRLAGIGPAMRVIQLERPHPRIQEKLSAVRRRQNRPRGLFIVFEGGEGAGKTTQSRYLVRHLYQQRDADVTVTREPGATDLGHMLRGLLLDKESGDPPTARAEALMYAADRAHHVETVVRPSLARGAMVVSDRYVDSSLAYQGAGRALGDADVAWLARFATGGLVPDLTVLLDVPAHLGLERASRRGDTNRFEAESLKFHTRVRDRFLALASADAGRYLVVPAAMPVEEIAANVAWRVDHLLAGHRPESPGYPGGEVRRAARRL